MNPVAVLVEDDNEQASESIEILERVGFAVRCFPDIETVSSFLYSTADLIDLFVLDRRLPVRIGEPESDELGDDLRDRIDSARPDCRMIVFTGHSSVSHVQASVDRRGQLFADSSDPIDRVTVLEKTQSIEFEQRAKEFYERVRAIDDIELKVEGGMPPETARVLRRVAHEFQGDSITASALEGGLTGSDVWRCEVRANNVPMARLVAKVVGNRSLPGGLQDLLPHQNAARSVRTISGLTGGRYINILQYAGADALALLEVIAADPNQAATQIRKLKELLVAVAGQEGMRSLSEVCAPFIEWDTLVERLEARGMSVPSGTARTSVLLGSRHGDLHPGNVLVVEGEPVLIDFDSSCTASGLVDPVTALLSTLVHPQSPIRGVEWPDVDEIGRSFGDEGFGESHQHREWFSECSVWIAEVKRGDREFWSLVLAFCVRQLGYDDVLANPEIARRVEAVAEKACSELDKL